MTKLLKRISQKDLQKLLPKRASTANKTAGGKCLIIAGSKGQRGACYLCGSAAARIGAGYVYIPEDNYRLAITPDFLSLKITSRTPIKDYSAIAFGPGLRKSITFQKLFTQIENKFIKPVVIDAGGLAFVKKLKSNWIATPHEGELARMLDIPSADICKNRLKFVKQAQRKFGGIIVLKGHHTLIATKTTVYEIQTGNKALAKAGTGDVLTGMIAGLLSQGLKPIDAAILAVGLHGTIADRWVKHKDYLSLMASDLIQELPATVFKLRKKRR